MTRTMSYPTMQVFGIFRSRPAQFKTAPSRAPPVQLIAVPADGHCRSRIPFPKCQFRSNNNSPMGLPRPRA